MSYSVEVRLPKVIIRHPLTKEVVFEGSLREAEDFLDSQENQRRALMNERSRRRSQPQRR